MIDLDSVVWQDGIDGPTATLSVPNVMKQLKLHVFHYPYREDYNYRISYSNYWLTGTSPNKKNLEEVKRDALMTAARLIRILSEVTANRNGI